MVLACLVQPSQFVSEPSDGVQCELTVLHSRHGVIHEGAHFANDDDAAATEDEGDALTVTGG